MSKITSIAELTRLLTEIENTPIEGVTGEISDCRGAGIVSRNCSSLSVGNLLELA